MARTSLLKVAGIFLVSVVAVAATVWIWRWSLERSRWNHLEARVGELRAQLDTRFRPRPVLRGAPVPGNAWDDYLPAIEMLKDADPETRLSDDVRRDWQQKYGAAVEAMQRGTHRAGSGWAHLRERQKGKDPEEGFLGQVLVLGDIAVDRAGILAKNGKHREATELLLDLLKFAEDVGNDGAFYARMAGWGLQEKAIVGLEDALMNAPLTAQDCRQIDRELAQLDATYPRLAPMILSRLEEYGEWILKEKTLQDLVGCRGNPENIKVGWREMYSDRLMRIAGFNRADALMSRLVLSDDGTEAEQAARRQKFVETAQLEGLELTNVYFSMFTCSDYLPDAGRGPSLRSTLRALRIGARFAATGEVLELTDINGEKIATGFDAGKLVLWSGNSQRNIPRRHD